MNCQCSDFGIFLIGWSKQADCLPTLAWNLERMVKVYRFSIVLLLFFLACNLLATTIVSHSG